ncbi:MAG: squalene--hopene cyclase [Mycobacteriaceae bacterium]|nr:squalene--hopene cyclase [Mycobacteriaceae bacterium]
MGMERYDNAEPEVAEALRRGVDCLLASQSPEGWWKGPLSTCAPADAQDLFLREVLGIRDETRVAESGRWIRSLQRADGMWAMYEGGPGELATTVEAFVGLRICGDTMDEPHMRRAADRIRNLGGVAQTRVVTRFWLAMLGLWSWDDIPVLPPEMILLPRWAPLNIYSWACWVRQIIVPFTVIGHFRPQCDLGFTLGDLAGDIAARPRAAGAVSTVFHGLDRVLHAYERAPVKPLRATALRRAQRWILERQEADGSWGGIQPPHLCSIIALWLLGMPLDHPVLAAALRGLDGFVVHEDTPEGPARWVEVMQGPVWDTALSVLALTDAGTPADHPALKRAADWLLDQEVRTLGDWAVQRPELSPGAWPFEFANAQYPDLDDPAAVVRALDRVGGAEAAARRGVAWSAGMQSRDGGWGAFDADNTRTLATRLPFCDFADVIDPPSADVTAHLVEMLAEQGGEHAGRVDRGVRWLLAHQERDGSWFGRWGVNHVYGTGAVVPALIAAGVPPSHPAIRRALEWLAAHQNLDGGWGEDPQSYGDAQWVGSGPSTASQTAWALLALVAAGERTPVTRRGVDWLVRAQRSDGDWDEPQYTGTGLPGVLYIRYPLYRIVFPLSALGRYLAMARERERS